jgi:hypothetical protein
MELAFQKKPKIKIVYDGVEYFCDYPTVAMQREFQGKIEKAKEDGSSIDVLLNWAIALGLPKEFVESLDMDTFSQMIESIASAGVKKK